MDIYQVGRETLSLNFISALINNNSKLELSETVSACVSKCRSYLDNKLRSETQPIYGINTGFGYLQHVKFSFKIKKSPMI